MAWPWTRTTPPGADVQSNATLFSKNLKIRIVDLHNFWKRDYNLTKRDAFNTVKHWLYISIIFLRCDPQTKKYQVGFLEISLKKALIRLLLLYHKRDHDTMHTNLPGADVQDQSHTRHLEMLIYRSKNCLRRARVYTHIQPGGAWAGRKQ